MYRIEAAWEVGKQGRPVHMFYVNGEKVSGRASDVCKRVQGPKRSDVILACGFAKTDNVLAEFCPTPMGWQCVYGQR